MAKKLPWAVVLCRFKGVPGDSAIEQFYRSIFAPGTGGLIEYWRDVSLGAIDVSGSRVYGWTELDLKRENAGMGETSRQKLVDYAISAAQRDRIPVNEFYSVVAVFTHRWSKDGAPEGADWRHPEWGQFWIDDSAVGRKVVQAPPFDGNVLAHEMGHGFDMQHDCGADLMATSAYADPCCIMSQNNSFTHPTWNVAFGPALCLPHLIQRGWMFERRVYYDNGSWQARSDGITLPLAQVTDPGARANLGVKLAYKQDANFWDYYLEYVTPVEWNQGLPKPYLIVRRMASVQGIGETPIYLGVVEVPQTLGTSGEFEEPMGGVRFRVERFDAVGRIVKVNARKL